MKNLNLKHGKCPACKDQISLDWAGPEPTLGTLCESCTYQDFVYKVFTPAHFDFKINPGPFEDVFNGTRLIINGQVCEIIDTGGSSCIVKFEDGATETLALGYDTLLQIHTNRPAKR